MTEPTATAAEPFDPTKIEGHTPDFRTELAAQLAELAPEAVADGKIDVDKLKELLDGDADDTSERFGLFWPGKKRAIRAAQTPTSATLAPDYNNSKNWDTTQNVFIEGDNLEVLKILQKHYHGKIKMIYIDPPYNTGKDFVYPDNFKEGVDNYLQWSKQVNEEGKPLSTNTETGGRIHTNWLNMMYPRLKLARNLLTDDGVIFISIDDHELPNVLKLAGEVFGESNLLATISVVNNLKGRSDDIHFATANEFLVVCARNSAKANIAGLPTSDDYKAEFKLEDDISRFKEVGLQKTGKGNRRIDRPKMYYPIYFNPETSEFSLSPIEGAVEIYPSQIDGVDGRWRWGKDTFEANKETELTARNIRGNWRVFVKMRDIVDGEARTIRPKTYWADPKYDTAGGSRAVKELFNGSNLFDNPKPVPFLTDILRTAAPQRGTILDFFSGSGTTAHAVMQLNAEDGGNRRHIQVQLPEPTEEGKEARNAGYDTIADVARERIRRAGEKIEADYADQLAQRDTPLDTGFRAYKLTDTNFTKWDIEPGAPLGKIEEHLFDLRDSANDNATTDAILTELLLKQGMSLTEHVTDTTIAGLNCKAITDTDGDPVLLAYVDEHNPPTIDQLRQMVDTKPARLVILEDCFQGNDELKTNLKQMCATHNIELKTA